MLRLLNPPTVEMPSGRRARHPGIASSLRAAITGGQIGPGERLPSSRDLAAHFGVHRHTIAEALDSLVAEGWVEAAPRRAFSVGFDLPMGADFAPRRGESSSPPKWRFVRDGPSLGSPDPARVRYALHSATPDPRLLPRDELRAAYGSVLRARRLDAFDMGDERGLPRLLRALGSFLRRARGLTGRELLLTHGSQEAIALVAQALLAAGDTVVVGDPGYPPAWDAFRAAGARLAAIPVDEQGIDVDALGRVLARRRCRLVYLTPGRHYPTTASLSAPRRVALLEMTRRAGVPVLEDDYDHEHHYRASPPPPLALEAPHVIYVSTLSKAIAPGIRIGFVAAPTAVVERLVRLRRMGTRGNNGITQAAIAAWMEEGGFERHLRRARQAYRARRDAAFAAVERARESGCDVTCRLPEGGLALWTHWGAIDTRALALRARERGVLFVPESVLRVATPSARTAVAHGARIAFSRSTPDDLRIAIGLVAEEARALARQHG
jgi:GntR family transcriptional regulator/MocR family aminotransferase